MKESLPILRSLKWNEGKRPTNKGVPPWMYFPWEWALLFPSEVIRTSLPLYTHGQRDIDFLFLSLPNFCSTYYSSYCLKMVTPISSSVIIKINYWLINLILFWYINFYSDMSFHLYGQFIPWDQKIHSYSHGDIVWKLQREKTKVYIQQIQFLSVHFYEFSINLFFHTE